MTTIIMWFVYLVFDIIIFKWPHQNAMPFRDLIPAFLSSQVLLNYTPYSLWLAKLEQCLFFIPQAFQIAVTAEPFKTIAVLGMRASTNALSSHNNNANTRNRVFTF